MSPNEEAQSFGPQEISRFSIFDRGDSKKEYSLRLLLQKIGKDFFCWLESDSHGFLTLRPPKDLSSEIWKSRAPWINFSRSKPKHAQRCLVFGIGEKRVEKFVGTYVGTGLFWIGGHRTRLASSFHSLFWIPYSFLQENK